MTLGAALVHPIADKPILSFAFFGCNRVDKEDWSKDVNPSSANVHQLEQTFRDISNIKPVPAIVFGGGDLVLGYDSVDTTYGQLRGWQQQFFQSDLAGKTTMIPFPGNHELNKKTDKGKLPNPETVPMWNRWYAQSGFRQMSANGPSDGGVNKDKLIGDQSRLNYSFDRNGVHFVVLNTDTVTSEKDPKTGLGKVAWIPARWARKDIEAAQKDKHIKAIFVTGHRNLVDGISSKGDSPIDKEPGAILLDAIRSNPKVRAYVCAHVHAWDSQNLGGASKAWQIIAGNGGSSLEKDWTPSEGTFFGFVVLDVFKSGKVVLHNYKRPTPAAPQKYCDPFPVHPAPAVPVDTVLFDPVK